jgi:hypothetical protein
MMNIIFFCDQYVSSKVQRYISLHECEQEITYPGGASAILALSSFPYFSQTTFMKLSFFHLICVYIVRMMRGVKGGRGDQSHEEVK